MLVPRMLDLAEVMAESGFTEEQVFDEGILGKLVFLVVVAEVGACRVPAPALSHFMAGADTYSADAMPEHYSGTPSGQWTIKRDRLRILAKSWNELTENAEEIDRLDSLAAAAEAECAQKSIPIVYHLPLHDRLEPRTGWQGSRLADTDLFTLEEAASMASKHAGTEVTTGDFLRAAGRGEIVLRAICRRAVTMHPIKPSDKPLLMPERSIPTLPLEACRALSNTRQATWRAIDGFENDDFGAFQGSLCRFSRWQLPPDEPDLVTTPEDCRVTGYDVHALADAFVSSETEASAPATLNGALPDNTPSAAPLIPQRFENTFRERSQEAATIPVFSMTRSSLIDAHEHEWPSIRRDIQDASANGLSAAKARNRGWYEARALDWARAKGKLKSIAQPAQGLDQVMRNMAGLQGTKHRLDD